MQQSRTDQLIAASLVATVVLGAVLRAWLGGSGWLPIDFRHLRHAHTHMGWYGAIFPLAFAVWRGRGWWTPGSRVMAGYWVAVALSTAGFLRAGYGVEAIIGSTVELGVWLLVVFHNRAQLHWRREDWLAAVPVLVVLAAASIPPLAMTLRPDPALSARWVRTFLTLLLFGAGVPAALDRARFRAPPGALWGFAVVCCALWVGVLQHPWLLPGTLLLGGLLAGSAAVSRAARWDLRLGVGLMGGGLLAVAAGVLPFDPSVAVAGVHLAVLGPVLHGLHGDPARTTPTSVGLLGLVLVMCGAIVATTAWPTAPGAVIAAWSGGILAFGTAVWAVVPGERAAADREVSAS